MESHEAVEEGSLNLRFVEDSDKLNVEDDHKKMICDFLRDAEFKSHFDWKYANRGFDNVSTNVRYEFVGMNRSASVAVMNTTDGSNNLDVEEHKFFVRLKSSAKELRSKMWEKRETRDRRELEDEMLRWDKHRKVALRNATETIESVQSQLMKTASLTFLRGRLREAQINNKELKESIYHKMSDRSILRLSPQPDMARLVWQIVALKSQVTVMQERLRYLTEKFQDMSTTPVPNKEDSSNFREGEKSSLTLVFPKSTKDKHRSNNWKTLMSRIFGSKKNQD